MYSLNLFNLSLSGQSIPTNKTFSLLKKFICFFAISVASLPSKIVSIMTPLPFFKKILAVCSNISSQIGLPISREGILKLVVPKYFLASSIYKCTNLSLDCLQISFAIVVLPEQEAPFRIITLFIYLTSTQSPYKLVFEQLNHHLLRQHDYRNSFHEQRFLVL